MKIRRLQRGRKKEFDGKNEEVIIQPRQNDNERTRRWYWRVLLEGNGGWGALGPIIMRLD